MEIAAASPPHVPVLIGPLIAACSPVQGTWLDGTFGAGGYTQRLLDAGADKIIGVDRDPAVFKMAQWAIENPAIELVENTFSNLDAIATDLDGVVLDLGVSSMQLDQAERGFSFIKDGPLDMRMSQSGPSAADVVNTAEEDELADIQTCGEALLRTAGYAQYEISAYSQPGKHSAHNLNYWTFGDYIGIGAGAHGKITGDDGSVVRTRRSRSPRDYLAGVGEVRGDPGAGDNTVEPAAKLLARLCNRRGARGAIGEVDGDIGLL